MQQLPTPQAAHRPVEPGRLPAWFTVLLGVLTGIASPVVQAAALQVSPIRLDLSAAQPAAALTLHNDGLAPLNAQVRVFAWSQTLDEDHLERTDRIVASPPIVQIPPGADQTVRILRVSTAPVAAEETYRLLIDEIPDGQGASMTGVRVQLRYSVPVFVGAPEAGRPPLLDFSLGYGKGGALALSAANRSSIHAQISKVRLDWSNGHSSVLSPGLLGYALPSNTRRWPIVNAPVGAHSATLHAVVNGTPLTVPVTVPADIPAPASH